MSNLTVRILTAIIAGSAVIALIALSPYGLLGFCVVVSLLGLLEFYKISGLKSLPGKILFFLLAMGTWVYALHHLSVYYGNIPEALFSPVQWSMPPVLFFGFLFFLLLSLPLSAIALLYDKTEQAPLVTMGKLVLGMVYVVVPMVLFFILSVTWIPDPGGGQLIPMQWSKYALGILFLTWTVDSFAYFGGRLMGKNKLFERISPKKTWEGTLTGAAFCIGLGFLLNYLWPVAWNWVVVALIISVFSQLGDLVESMIKRSLELKDSGGLLPGHGGILDRFDGLLISMPFLYFYLQVELFLGQS